MKKLIISILILIFISQSAVFSSDTDNNRRIEEDKRESLLDTEDIVTYKDWENFIYDEEKDVYFSQLLSRKITFLSDAFSILVILLGAEDKYVDFVSQRRFLEENKIINKNFFSKYQTEAPLRKGVLAYLILKALKIKGGLHLRIFPESLRYSLKELEYLEIIKKSSHVEELVSGNELLQILSKSADYLAETEK